MPTTIILAMHGAPPNDFPRAELTEFFGLHARLEHARNPDPVQYARYQELEAKVRSWPRTETNDLFNVASHAMANALSKETGAEVLVGYNEFCAPTVSEALDEAVSRGAARVVVITPMMTRGGEHAEKEIPELVREAQERHPNVRFEYRWPFDQQAIARFLAAHVGPLD